MLAYIPAPLPDEVVTGYMRRIAACHAAPGSMPLTMSLTELAEHTKLAENSILYRHTCLGYARFTNVAQASKPLHEHTDLLTNRILLSMGQSLSYRYCPDCAQDDLTEWGCPYFRRYHQLAGIDRCDHHEVALAELPRPQRGSPRSTTLPSHLNKTRRSTQSNPTLRRFFELSMMALQGTTPSHPEQLADALVGRAQALGLRMREQKSGPRFSDLVREQLPSDWLAKHFGSTKPENTMDGIFRAYRAPYRTACYLLAMAVLWDSPKDAMAACAGRPSANSTAVANTVGVRMINAVLAGMSIRAACRQEHGCVSDLEVALRKLLGTRVGEPVTDIPV